MELKLKLSALDIVAKNLANESNICLGSAITNLFREGLKKSKNFLMEHIAFQTCFAEVNEFIEEIYFCYELRLACFMIHWALACFFL